MSFPKLYYRETKHKKPRKQFYRPGFNAANGCWLEGKWVTVTDEQWADREAHQALYADVREQIKRQHYRDEGVAPEAMTEAQRLAWEYYSGDQILDVRYESGKFGGVGVQKAGAAVTPESIRWLREQGCKVLRRVQQPDGEVVDQLEGVEGFPSDLVEDGEPVSVWHHIVDQNRKRHREMTETILDGPPEGLPTFPGMPAMMQMVALQELLELEKEAVRSEWDTQRGAVDVFRRDPEVWREDYVGLRQQFESKMPGFQEMYQQAKASHNECARINLDNSDGHLFCYVLPEFHSDGSHDPWGPKDVPWNAAADDD